MTNNYYKPIPNILYHYKEFYYDEEEKPPYRNTILPFIMGYDPQKTREEIKEFFRYKPLNPLSVDTKRLNEEEEKIYKSYRKYK